MNREDSGDQNYKSYTLYSTEDKIKRGLYGDAVIDLVDAILYKAISINASDIHFQPEDNFVRVRYRIDGILYDQESINNNLIDQVISRIKILSHLDISQKRLPQDGSFQLLLENELNHENDSKNNIELVDTRVSTFPTIDGEKIVLRLLVQNKNLLNLSALGLNNKMLKDLSIIGTTSHGFFLITGPTGSGKTTTIYSLLETINEKEKNIITIEDPVEYDFPGVSQGEVNNKTGFSFHNGLRSILRQDPDVILIGEIRDKVSLQIAIEASLTGHLVLSTLHTNGTVETISRLLDMGVEPFLINTTLTGVLTQRLIRLLCNECKENKKITEKEKAFLFEKGFSDIKTTFTPKGCKSCFNVGYKGRIGIFELLKIDNTIRDFISKKTSNNEITQFLLTKKHATLFDDAINKVRLGFISLEDAIHLLI